MDASTLRISLELMAIDASGGAFGTFTAGILGLVGMLSQLGDCDRRCC